MSCQPCRKQDGRYGNACWPQTDTLNRAKMFTKLFKMHYSGLGRGYLHSDYLNKTAMLIRSSLQILVFALLKTLAGEEGQPVGDMSVRKCTELQHQKMANGCSLPHHTPCQLWTCSAMQGSKILEKRNCHRREENKQTNKKAPKKQPQGRILKENLFSSQDPSILSAAGFIYII